MKILSLNINSFCGNACVPIDNVILGDEYKSRRWEDRILDVDHEYVDKCAVKVITQTIEQEQPGVIILQEYRRNFPSAKEFASYLKSKCYLGPFTSQEEKDSGSGFSTTVFAKHEIKTGNDLVFSPAIIFDGRIYAFEGENIIIIGAHMPFNPKDNRDNNKKSSLKSENVKDRIKDVEKQWDYLKIFFEQAQNQGKAVVLVGDLNVYDETTYQYQSFKSLLDVNVKDLWLEQNRGNDNASKTPTYKNGNRLDYVLLTPLLFNSHICKMRLFPEKDDDFLNNWTASDHRALIVEFEEGQSKHISDALSKLFSNGGETYTYEEMRTAFENEGVDVSNFSKIMENCVSNGFIIPCGANRFTR